MFSSHPQVTRRQVALGSPEREEGEGRRREEGRKRRKAEREERKVNVHDGTNPHIVLYCCASRILHPLAW
jgi:hypothetical protein